MKIERKIERCITLTPGEVYAAVAAKYDLPTGPDSTWFDMDVSCSSQVCLMVREETSQDLPDDA